MCRIQNRSLIYIDFVEQAAVLEVDALGLRPAAKYFIDRKQIDCRELMSIFFGDFRIARSIEVACRNFLPFFVVQVLEVGLGNITYAMFVDILVDDSDRGFGKNADRGNDYFEFLRAIFLERQKSFVFPGNQNIPYAALDEIDG